MKKLLILLPLLLGVLFGHAQFDFQISAAGVQGFPAIAEEDDIDSVSFFVHNSGNAAFAGDLYTFQRVDGQGPFPLDTLTVPQLAPGDSVLVAIEDYEFEANIFRLGSNPIVIWITDDNFSAVSNEDTSVVFIFNGPAFRFGQSGIVGFPNAPNPNQAYNFDIHVQNISEEDYTSRLFTHFAVNGDTQIVVSDSLLLPGESSIFLNVGYSFLLPPFAPTSNLLEIWVQGDSGAVAVDTAQFNIDFSAVGAGEKWPRDHIRIFPNPARHTLTVSSAGLRPTDSVTLFNSLGQCVGESRFHNGRWKIQQLDLLPEGIYFLHIEQGRAQVLRRKILIQ